MTGNANCPIVDPPMNAKPCLTKHENKCFSDADCINITDSRNKPTHCCHYDICGGKTCGPQPPSSLFSIIIYNYNN